MYAYNLFTLPELSPAASHRGMEVGGECVVGVSDQIFVNAVQYGRVVLECSLTGCESVEQVLCRVRDMLENAHGLVTVNLRNRSQGWTLRRALRFKPVASLLATA